jgi:tungstate transport system permease protein
MIDIWRALERALDMIISLDAALVEIVLRSLQINLFALSIAALIGLPLGAATALYRFPLRKFLAVLLSAMMGLPPVVVGLLVYLLLSRSGPLGVFGLLFTPTAMIIAQVILITPIIAAISRQALDLMWRDYEEQFQSLGVPPSRRLLALIWDGRFSLLTALLAGFGRASAEVGAVMIVGGNIDHVSRVMTTSIALEISRGDLSLALALGFVLLALSLAVNGASFVIRDTAERRYGQ